MTDTTRTDPPDDPTRAAPADRPGLNRRDFLRAGAATGGALAVVGLLDLAGVDDVLEADGQGFYIRHHSPEDPPYVIDDELYERTDGTTTSFGNDMSRNLLRMENQTKNIEQRTTGSDRLAFAYSAGAGRFMFNGLYDWNTEPVEAMMNAAPDGRWDPAADGYSSADVTAAVKHASKLFGASLVGVAGVDERWFYSLEGMGEGMGTELLTAPPTSAADEGEAPLGGDNSGPAMPDTGAMSPDLLVQMLSADDRRSLLGDLVARLDSAVLPDGLDATVAATASDDEIVELLGQVMTIDDPAVMSSAMDYVDLGALGAMPTAPGEEVDEVGGGGEPGAGEGIDPGMVAGMAKTIRFADDIDEPLITDTEKIIPTSMDRVIVLAFEIDPGAVNTAVSLYADAGTQNAYSRMTFTAACVAEMIRSLGYQAISMGNDTALSQAMAVDAGLGEMGRNGLLITPKYGPRVRLAKVVTDLPLDVDGPITFGVTEFCEVCEKCSDECPSDALPDGGRTFDAPDSGTPGHYHWAVDGDRCHQYWADVGGSCSNCIRVCPFNKPDRGWLHEATRILIGVESGPLDRLLVKLDDAAGYGPSEGNDPAEFFETETFVHIT